MKGSDRPRAKYRPETEGWRAKSGAQPFAHLRLRRGLELVQAVFPTSSAKESSDVVRGSGEMRWCLINQTQRRIPNLTLRARPLEERVRWVDVPDSVYCRAGLTVGAAGPGDDFWPERRLSASFRVDVDGTEVFSTEILLDGQIPAKRTAESTLQVVAAQSGPAERPSQNIIRIFLASSQDLLEDRDAFELFVRQQNDSLQAQGRYLQVTRWETLSGALSKTRSQDRYNDELVTCDMFVALVFTKAGMYLQEEFDCALECFKERGRPRVYTFFKDDVITTGSARKEDMNSRWDFEQKLKEASQFHGVYRNVEDLQLQFRRELDLMFSPPPNPRRATPGSGSP